MEKIILVTNDDGIHSRGIRELVDVAKDFGKVYVIAPDSPQSGMGHAVTIRDILRVEKVDTFGEEIVTHTCSGTPADCVKIGIRKILPRFPDMVLSGINHGSNENCNLLYSGTMAAAVEASLANIFSMGFSFLNSSYSADFTQAKKVVKYFLTNIDPRLQPKGISLNINIPKAENIKGIRICKQGEGYYEEVFEERLDTEGNVYYWLGGELHKIGMENESCDSYYLSKGYVSVVPVKHDMTDYECISNLSKLNHEF